MDNHPVVCLRFGSKCLQLVDGPWTNGRCGLRNCLDIFFTMQCYDYEWTSLNNGLCGNQTARLQRPLQPWRDPFLNHSRSMRAWRFRFYQCFFWENLSSIPGLPPYLVTSNPQVQISESNTFATHGWDLTMIT